MAKFRALFWTETAIIIPGILTTLQNWSEMTSNLQLLIYTDSHAHSCTSCNTNTLDRLDFDHGIFPHGSHKGINFARARTRPYQVWLVQVPAKIANWRPNNRLYSFTHQ